MFAGVLYWSYFLILLDENVVELNKIAEDLRMFTLLYTYFKNLKIQQNTLTKSHFRDDHSRHKSLSLETIYTEV